MEGLIELLKVLMLYAVLNPTECMDQLWMGKGGGMPTPDKLDRQNGHPRVLGETPT